MAHEDLVADREFWKKRALAAEQERDEWEKAARHHAQCANFMTEKSDHYERELVHLRARIKALADKWEWTYVGYVRRFLVPALRALTEKGD